MTSTQFKTKLKEIKNFLQGKEINLTFRSNGIVQKFKFTSLRSFGNKVLELERLGAGFGFVKVGNALVERHTVTDTELNKWMRKGTWSEIHIDASMYKY